jgi:hypothetical protein
MSQGVATMSQLADQPENRSALGVVPGMSQMSQMSQLRTAGKSL